MGVVRFRGNCTILATKFAVVFWKNPELHIWSYSMHKSHFYQNSVSPSIPFLITGIISTSWAFHCKFFFRILSLFNSFRVLNPLHQLPILSDLQGKRMFSEVHFRVWDGRIGARRFWGSRTMFKYCKIGSEFGHLDQSEKKWRLHLWDHSMHTSQEFPKIELHKNLLCVYSYCLIINTPPHPTSNSFGCFEVHFRIWDVWRCFVESAQCLL